MAWGQLHSVTRAQRAATTAPGAAVYRPRRMRAEKTKSATRAAAMTITNRVSRGRSRADTGVLAHHSWMVRNTCDRRLSLRSTPGRERRSFAGRPCQGCRHASAIQDHAADVLLIPEVLTEELVDVGVVPRHNDESTHHDR